MKMNNRFIKTQKTISERRRNVMCILQWTEKLEKKKLSIQFISFQLKNWKLIKLKLQRKNENAFTKKTFNCVKTIKKKYSQFSLYITQLQDIAENILFVFL